MKYHELEAEIQDFSLHPKRLPLPEAQGKKFWAAREELNQEKFIEYWSNQAQANAAWQIIHLAQSNFDRPKLQMFYPNDPMWLYDMWQNDSLDDVEFIITLEEEFNTQIPDDVSSQMFTSYTVQETAQYLLAHQNTKIQPLLKRFFNKKSK